MTRRSIYVVMFSVLAVFISCKEKGPLELLETPTPQKFSENDTGHKEAGVTEEIKTAEQVYTNSIGMQFVTVPDGEFYMGSCKKSLECGQDANIDEKAGDDESPYRVHLDAFKIGVHEVTLGQFKKFVNDDKSGSNLLKYKSEDESPVNVFGDDAPVTYIQHETVLKFIDWLNKKEGLEGKNRYRLPTEAEWEYAARAGTKTVYSWGDKGDDANRYSWNTSSVGSKKHPRPVGEKKPNHWGLYDMHGNAFEMVSDWYYKRSVGNDESVEKIFHNPEGVSENYIKNRHKYYGNGGEYCEGESEKPCHVKRGGSYLSDVEGLRSAARGAYGRELFYADLGFRLVKGN